MCYSRAEGGQRCYGHALKRLETATAVMQMDPTNDAAWDRYLNADIELCSTPRGEEDARRTVEAWRAEGVDPQTIAAKEDTIARGVALRERNLAVRIAVKAANQPVTPSVPERPVRPPARPLFPVPDRTEVSRSTQTSPAVEPVNAKPAFTFQARSIRPGDGAAERSFMYRRDLKDLCKEVEQHHRLTRDPDRRQEWMKRLAQGDATTSADDPYTTFAETARAQIADTESLRYAIIGGRAAEVVTGAVENSRSMRLLLNLQNRLAARQGDQVLTAAGVAEGIVAQVESLRNPGAPEGEAQKVAVLIYGVLRKSPDLSKKKARKWAEDMVRDLSGNETTVRPRSIWMAKLRRTKYADLTQWG